MGYYSTLHSYNIQNAKIDPLKKEFFLMMKEENCNFAFGDNCNIKINEKGEIEEIEFKNYNCKWYDAEEFEKILKDFLIEGSIEFNFIGEDTSQWGFAVFPDVSFSYDCISTWKELDGDIFMKILVNSYASSKVKKELIKEYKNFWEEKKQKADDNLAALAAVRGV